MAAGSGLSAGGPGMFDAAQLARRVAAIGSEVTPQAADASYALYAPYHRDGPDVRVHRDLSYGADPRQQLDVFTPARPGGPRPVVLFAHGGGFVAGGRRRPDGPFHDNVGRWAVRRGMVGVTMSYRLAPQHRWPAGAQDVAAAVAWVRSRIGVHGGDPARVHLMGTSAGAVHAATYLAHPRFHPAGGPGVASVVLLSGAYDLPSFEAARLQPYLGDDPDVHRAASPLTGLLASPVPVHYVLAEHDPAGAQRQAALLVDAHTRRTGHPPDLFRLAGHNHFTTTAHLDTPDDALDHHLLSRFSP